MADYPPDTPPESDPFEWFGDWLQDAKALGMPNPEAVTLATVDEHGFPWARAVLLKGFDRAGFVFYTNLGSPKGRQLLDNGRAALCFYWRVLERQVRIRGLATPVPDAEADAYFATRPRGSQLGAWASKQSAPLVSRAALLGAVVDEAARFGLDPIPRPSHWSGFLLVPDAIEFWRGQPDRLHDRWEFTRAAQGWSVQRLSP